MDHHYLLPDISRHGKIGVSLPHLDVPQSELPSEELLRKELDLPEVSEVELVRYFTALSKLNYGVDTWFSPLASCTLRLPLLRGGSSEDSVSSSGSTRASCSLSDRLQVRISISSPGTVRP